MNYRAYWNFEWVEIPINGVPITGQQQTQFVFPDLPQIRTAPIYSIQVMVPSFVTSSYLTGGTLVPVANMKQCFLSLFTNPIPGDTLGDDKLAIDGVPLFNLNYVNDATNPYVWNEPMFAGQTVVWPKSYITFKVPPGNTANWVMCFGIKYGNNQKVQQ